ncbi:unnamed protein product [Auanema sp. JU1783]|nr:unnamed protein product [Auanema sp. JU1783]
MSGKVCVKCPEAAVLAGVDVKKAVYCKNCFIQMVIHKFRSSISKKRIFKAIIVFDGTSSGVFLLRQVKESMEMSEYKKLMIKPTILVLVSATENAEIEKVEAKIRELRLILSDVPWFIVHVASALAKQNFVRSEKCQGVQEINALDLLLKSCQTQTSRAEVKRILIEKTCIQVSKALGISKILVPENGDYLGRLALTQLCLGRGPAVSELTAVVDKRANKVWFVRPLRDINKKEIALVNHLKGYEQDVIVLQRDKPAVTERSIQSATTLLVDNLLAQGYKSTITTVLSTAGKLHMLTSAQYCSLCTLSGVDIGSNFCKSCLDLKKELSEPQLLDPLLF